MQYVIFSCLLFFLGWASLCFCSVRILFCCFFGIFCHFCSFGLVTCWTSHSSALGLDLFLYLCLHLFEVKTASTWNPLRTMVSGEFYSAGSWSWGLSSAVQMLKHMFYVFGLSYRTWCHVGVAVYLMVLVGVLIGHSISPGWVLTQHLKMTLQPFAANKPSSLATTSCGQSICNTYVVPLPGCLHLSARSESQAGNWGQGFFCTSSSRSTTGNDSLHSTSITCWTPVLSVGTFSTWWTGRVMGRKERY